MTVGSDKVKQQDHMLVGWRVKRDIMIDMGWLGREIEMEREWEDGE